MIAENIGEVAELDRDTLKWKDGGYIHEICANWTGESPTAAGTAHYSFYMIQGDHRHEAADEPQTVEDPVSSY